MRYRNTNKVSDHDIAALLRDSPEMMEFHEQSIRRKEAERDELLLECARQCSKPSNYSYKEGRWFCWSYWEVFFLDPAEAINKDIKRLARIKNYAIQPP